MKPYKTLLLSSILFFSTLLSAHAQQLHKEGEVPIENYWSYMESLSQQDIDFVPKGTYFKDINHVLTKYVGTWTGSYKGKDYLIVINSSTLYLKRLKMDILAFRYKITNGTGDILVNTLQKLSSSPYVAEGLYFSRNDSHIYCINYIGENSKCGNMGTLLLDIAADGQTMHLYINPSGDLINSADCPNGGVTPPFPTNSKNAMVLTKTGPAPNPPGGGLQLDPKYQ